MSFSDPFAQFRSEVCSQRQERPVSVLFVTRIQIDEWLIGLKIDLGNADGFQLGLPQPGAQQREIN